jgi:hypothetical protein
MIKGKPDKRALAHRASRFVSENLSLGLVVKKLSPPLAGGDEGEGETLRQ